jgi:glucose/arabinose dehydrogenase
MGIQDKQMKKLSIGLFLTALFSSSTHAQTNAGEQKSEPNLPFHMTQVASFDLPWRIAFLPDGRMLVTEKVGRVQLVTPQGAKTEVEGVPPSYYQGQNGMLGVFVSPHYATDHNVYLTYVEPGVYGGGLALGRGQLVLDGNRAALHGFEVLWRQVPAGKGGQAGAQIAFSPDGKYLFLTVGDRQRMTPAQDPSQPVGKILRLTLDGKPAPGNPMEGKTGTASIPLIDPPRDTEAAKTARVVSTYTFPKANFTPAETWTTGHRTPYGLAFGPDGRLWEVEHGPRGGDELNLIEPGKNYGWPLVVYGKNYNGVPIASPDTRPDLTKPVIYWDPVNAPGNIMFYKGSVFPQWNGSALISGLVSKGIDRVTVDGKGGATVVQRWTVGKRVRDIEEAPDGTLWMLEDARPGGLFHLTPK